MENSRGLSPLSPSSLSLTYWCTALCLTPLCAGVPELCAGRLKQRRYWKDFYCRSALKMMSCVKISDAETHEEVDGRRLLWSPRRKTRGLLLPCVRPGSHLQCEECAVWVCVWQHWQHYICTHRWNYVIGRNQVKAGKQEGEITCTAKILFAVKLVFPHRWSVMRFLLYPSSHFRTKAGIFYI